MTAVRSASVLRERWTRLGAIVCVVALVLVAVLAAVGVRTLANSKAGQNASSLPPAQALPRTEAALLAIKADTGALATLLATPCTAPFLGTAIAFALSRGPGEIYAIFFALGLGLSLPYLAVAAAPGIATRLPRPGAWMATLRRILALALAATGLWLLWVLSSSSGLPVSLAVGVLMIAAVGALALMQRARLAVVAMIAFAFIAPQALGTSTTPERVADGDLWRPFDRAEIPRLVAAGKTVVVDVTADWCLTCQVNKRLVIADEAISKRLKAPDVVALRADWTRPDRAIADYLASHGRYGIPFNVVYGPGRPDGVVLPELLTVSAMVEAIETAGRR